jgi:hypothetical protein
MNLLQIINKVKGFYKRLDLDENQLHKLVEKLEEKNVKYKVYIEKNQIEGIHIYGDKISYKDLENIINYIRN